MLCSTQRSRRGVALLASGPRAPLQAACAMRDPAGAFISHVLWWSSLCRPAAAAASKGKELAVHGGAVGPGKITAEAKAALGGTVMVPTAAGGQVRLAGSAVLCGLPLSHVVLP